MWWFYKRIRNDATMAVYAYGHETEVTTGELAYNKLTGEFSVLKIANNDSEYGAKWALEHFRAQVAKENFPETRMVAIG